MKIIITILLLSVVLSGCVTKTGTGIYNFETGKELTIRGARQINVDRIDELFKEIDQLKDYLGVVEWTEKRRNDKTCEDGGCLGKTVGEYFFEEETYLTSDPLKVEWVELECENVKLNCRGIDFCYSLETYYRCQELKELIK